MTPAFTLCMCAGAFLAAITVGNCLSGRKTPPAPYEWVRIGCWALVAFMIGFAMMANAAGVIEVSRAT